MINTSDGAVLVTGGCGFIGTWVIRNLLRRGRCPVVLDATPAPARWDRVIGPQGHEVPLVRGDLLEEGMLDRLFGEYPIRHVIHLAALLTPACQNAPWMGAQVNLMGSLKLLEQIRSRGSCVVGFSYASSVAVFGDEPDHALGHLSESRPVTFYGVFKKSLELLAEQYFRHFGIASLGIRPQIAYGPEREVGLTAGPSLAARSAAAGATYHIGYSGSLGYDYVEDVAEAFVRGALNTPSGAQVVDLAGPVCEVDEVVAAINRNLASGAPLVTGGGPMVPSHSVPNPRYISELYADWRTTGLEEGMAKTFRFYRG